MAMDVRQMTFEDAESAFRFLSARLDKPETMTFDSEDGRWLGLWKADDWSLELSTAGVSIDSTFVRPTLFIHFLPDKIGKPLLRYDAALLLEPSGRPNEYMLCHKPLSQLLLASLRRHGPIGARLAEHLPASAASEPTRAKRQPPLDKFLTLQLHPTRLAHWLCRFGLHILVRDDAYDSKCYVCDRATFRGKALITFEADINGDYDEVTPKTGRFTDALNRASTPKEAQS